MNDCILIEQWEYEPNKFCYFPAENQEGKLTIWKHCFNDIPSRDTHGSWVKGDTAWHDMCRLLDAHNMTTFVVQKTTPTTDTP